MLEFALTIPLGLRFIIESVSGLGTLEIIRRCRRKVGSSRPEVEPLEMMFMNTADDIPVFVVRPSGVYGKLEVRMFFVEYLLNQPFWCTEGIVYWRVTPPVICDWPKLPGPEKEWPVVMHAGNRLSFLQTVFEAERKRISHMRPSDLKCVSLSETCDLLRKSFGRKREFEGLLSQTLWKLMKAGEVETLTAGEWKRCAERLTSARKRHSFQIEDSEEDEFQRRRFQRLQFQRAFQNSYLLTY